MLYTVRSVVLLLASFCELMSIDQNVGFVQKVILSKTWDRTQVLSSRGSRHPANKDFLLS